MLGTQDLEANRVQSHIDNIAKTAFPLLIALEEVADKEGISIEWVQDSARKFSGLLVQLLEARDVTQNRCD